MLTIIFYRYAPLFYINDPDQKKNPLSYFQTKFSICYIFIYKIYIKMYSLFFN